MAAEMAAALRGALSACLLLCGESGGLRLSRGVDGAAVSDGDLGSSPPRTFNGGGVPQSAARDPRVGEEAGGSGSAPRTTPRYRVIWGLCVFSHGVPRQGLLLCALSNGLLRWGVFALVRCVAEAGRSPFCFSFSVSSCVKRA